MSQSLQSDRTLLALIRTAKWSLDEAQMAHASAMKSHQAAELELRKASEIVDELDQQIVTILKEGVMNVTRLQNANLLRINLRVRVLECEAELHSCSQKIDETHHSLLETKARHELYKRLMERREWLQSRLTMRHRQSALDDMGAARVAPRLAVHFDLSGENQP